jgi:hypothetical protein
MIEKTPRARRMSEKELRARIDRVIAEEERSYGRLIELRDLFHAITGKLDSPAASLPNISNIVATPSRFAGASHDHAALRGGASPHPRRGAADRREGYEQSER